MYYLMYNFCKYLKNIFSIVAGQSLTSTGSNAEFDKGCEFFGFRYAAETYAVFVLKRMFLCLFFTKQK